MKVIIVHGSNPKDQEKLARGEPPQNLRHWIPGTKKKLSEKRIECITPLMPESWAPDYEKWKEEFEKIGIDEEDFVVATSAGAAFILRYLLGENKKLKKLILIAPYFLKTEKHSYLDKFVNFN